jgi:hypothetical protein
MLLHLHEILTTAAMAGILSGFLAGFAARHLTRANSPGSSGTSWPSLTTLHASWESQSRSLVCRLYGTSRPLN